MTFQVFKKRLANYCWCITLLGIMFIFGAVEQVVPVIKENMTTVQFWGVVILTVLILGNISHILLKMMKSVEEMGKRDMILRSVAMNKSSHFEDLFTLELDGYPVFSVLKEIFRHDLIKGYYEYLVQKKESYLKLVDGASLTSDKPKYINMAQKLESLPTWIEMNSKENKMRLSQQSSYKSDASTQVF